MKRLVAMLMLLAVTLTGCSAATEKHEESVSTPSAAHIEETEHTEAAATTTTATDPPNPNITGFGATDEAWNGTHTEDTNYDHEAAYNQNSSLPEGEGYDEYGDVKHTNGRVTGYEYHFNDESASEAKQTILAEQFPHDARIFDDETLPKCELMLVRSPTLVQALGEHGNPATVPVAQIELETGHDENDEEQPFDPSNVDGALVTEGYPGIEKIKPEC
jgi:hypothetical protein